MAGVDWGTAIAQGVLGGLGDAGQRYFADQRRMKMDDLKFKRQTKAFQDQATFQYNLKNIEQQRKTEEEWRQAAQMPTTELAYKLSSQAVGNLPKDMQEKATRQYLKRLNKKSHKELMAMGGYVLPDYSKYQGDPTYADVIPKATVANIDEMPGMDRVFETPDFGAEADPQAGMKQWQAEAQQRKTAYSDLVLGDGELRAAGIRSVDPSTLSLIDTDLQFGKQDATYIDSKTGQPINRVADSVKVGLESGTLDVYNGTIMSAYKVQALQELEAEMQEPLPSPEDMQGNEGGMDSDQESPMNFTVGQRDVAEYKADAAEEKRVSSEATKIGSTLAKENITGVIDQVGRAKDDLSNLSPESLDYVFGVLNETEGNVRKAADTLRKNKDPAAVEGAKAMQSLMAVLNVELKDRSGAAVTNQEAERFFQELGRASAVGSLEETFKGLDNLVAQKKSRVEAALQGRDEAVVRRFFETSPKYQEYFEEDENYGTPKGKQRAQLRTEIQTEGSSLIEQGEDPAEVQAYLQAVYGPQAQELGIELPTLGN